MKSSRKESLAKGVTLYLGDCRDILPAIKIDAVLTDPPYGLGKKMTGGTWGQAEKYSDLRDWDIAPTNEELTKLRCLAPSVIIWGGNYFDSPAARCWLIWDKTNALRTGADVELAWTNLDQPAKRYRAPKGDHQSGHPTEKPLGLMRWCLKHLPSDASVICDPYMGSGTTGVAAIGLGLKFTGIETIPKYFDIACKRISNELKTPSFIISKPQLIVKQQSSLLKGS